MRPKSFSIIFAGGGTGGHLNPGIAIAQEFKARNVRSRVLFLGTDRPLESALLSRAGFDHQCITAGAIKGRGFPGQIMSLLKVPRGIAESIRILREFRADLVVGIGSYASFPVAVGAWLMRCKIVLHEQNILPGMTNRMLGVLADRIYVSFTGTGKYFGRGKTMVSGNPVRSEIMTGVESGDEKDRQSEKAFTVLITGGSQGAHSINQAMMDGLTQLAGKNWLFIHQTGADDVEMVARGYGQHGIPSRVRAFFDDMDRQYRLADLVICRAGASTISEITTLGKGTILIPYPFHTDNHQIHNARALAGAGGADLILHEHLDGKTLAERIVYYASRPDALEQMGKTAKLQARADSASIIVDDCYQLMGACA